MTPVARQQIIVNQALYLTIEQHLRVRNKKEILEKLLRIGNAYAKTGTCSKKEHTNMAKGLREIESVVLGSTSNEFLYAMLLIYTENGFRVNPNLRRYFEDLIDLLNKSRITTKTVNMIELNEKAEEVIDKMFEIAKKY